MRFKADEPAAVIQDGLDVQPANSVENGNEAGLGRCHTLASHRRRASSMKHVNLGPADDTADGGPRQRLRPRLPQPVPPALRQTQQRDVPSLGTATAADQFQHQRAPRKTLLKQHQSDLKSVADASGSNMNTATQHQQAFQEPSTAPASEVNTGAGLTGFESLPSPALCTIFDRLSMRDLAAAACVCSSWRVEAADDRRWQRFWHANGQRQGTLWRWAAAAGGHREQLRGSRAIQLGAFTAEEFPLPRHDGPVKEIMLLEGQRRFFVTLHSKPAADWWPVRLTGDTAKLWDAGALRRRTPLLVVHDVLRSPTQLEDGQLILWRVRDDQVISKVGPPLAAECGAAGAHPSTSSNPAAEDGAPSGASRKKRRRTADAGAGPPSRTSWAQHPGIVASLLDPHRGTLTDIPLQSCFGHGAVPHEWLDVVGGGLASVHYDPDTRTLAADLFDRHSGVRLASTSMRDLPSNFSVASTRLDPAILTTSTGWTARGGRLLLAALLFDSHIYSWAMDEHFIPRAREAMLQPGAVPPSFDAVAPPVPPTPLGPDGLWGPTFEELAAHDNGPAEQAERPRGLYRLATMPYGEPIGDLSVSFPEKSVYIVGVQNFYVLGLDGSFLAYLNMAAWVPPYDRFAPINEIGGFCWPVPHSQRVAVHLESTNAIYLLDLARPMPSHGLMEDDPSQPPAATPGFVRLTGETPGLVPADWRLRTFPLRRHSKAHVTASRFRVCSNEPTVMEYTQCGEVLFTCGDPVVVATQRLMQPAVQYSGLQPPVSATPNEADTSAAPTAAASAGYSSTSRNRHSRCDHRSTTPVTSAPSPLAAKASVLYPSKSATMSVLVMLRSSTGDCIGAVPLRGVQESLHCAGGCVAAAIGPPKGMPPTAEGRVVLFNFVEGMHQMQQLKEPAMAREGTGKGAARHR